MPDFPVIVIGASELAAALPADLPAAVGVVLHVGTQPSILPQLLAAKSPLPAVHPKDGERLRPGRIYVAPPDHHLLLTADAVQLSRGPRENHARPAIDPLFRTAALHWRERAIGVVLTGELDDGTAGLQAIKDCGGTALVQDPAEALQPSMPASALANVAVDHCLPLAAIPDELARLVGVAPTARPGPAAQRVAREQAIFEGKQFMENLNHVAHPSALTCPECGGSLWEIDAAPPLRYRCHTGHAYTARTLDQAQAEAAEQARWSGIRALQEREMLLRRLANVAEATGDAAQAQAGRRQADRVQEQRERLVRQFEEGPGDP